MRIGIYDPYFDDLGGGEKYMMSIAQSLSSRHKVDVFWDRKEDVGRLLTRFHLDLSKVSFVKNIFSSKVSLFERLWQTKYYDAIVVLSDGSIPLVASKKLFLHIQQPLDATQTEGVWGKFKMSRVTEIFCNSNYTKSFVDKKLGFNTKIIYPPVSIYAKKMKKDNIILHVGRFRVANVGVADYKKQSVMIDAFKEMIKNGLRGWKFVLACGVREQDEKEFNLLKENAKGFPIVFEINKSNDALWSIYSKAKIYWHASGYGEDLQKHPEFAEHFGISTVEAMGAGVVPVVINAGGQTEIVTDNKDGLLWNSLDELKSKTLDLIGNQKLLQRLSTSAKIRAKDFSYENFSNTVNELLA